MLELIRNGSDVAAESAALDKAEAAGRTKAYLHAEVDEGGTKVHLHIDKLLPLQSW